MARVDELKKEAEEFTDSKKSFWRQGRTCIDSVRQAYLAGAEPREKRIAELEQKLEQTEKDLADYQFNYPKIKELEEENAELKSDFMICEKNADTYYDQLTKAKDLLERWLKLYNTNTVKGIIADTEKYLKEIENEIKDC